MSDPPDGSAPDIDDVTLAQPSTTHAVEMIGPYRLLQRAWAKLDKAGEWRATVPNEPSAPAIAR